jgi:FAD/FMN-containing dehydrogenase
MANDITSPTPSPEIESLQAQLKGDLIDPAHPDYNSTRVIWNGMIDRRPAIIVRCRNAADVAAAVTFARDHHLTITIRSGGHNVAGYAVSDGGLMIDLSLMNGVRVSPSLDRAIVEGGATWGDVDAATTPFGRATPGGLIAATGVAGLTLSGGIGWLRGTRGLCCDNLLAVDMVSAKGHLVRASETENPELLWALRGGGGNFGVVTSFEFRLSPLAPELFLCAPAYPEEHAREILPRWRDFMATAPDELSGLAEFSTIPSDRAFPEHAWGKRVVTLAHVYDGPAQIGEEVTTPLRNFGEPLVDFSGVMPYRTIQGMYDALFPKGRDRCYWKSTYLSGLGDGAIDEIVAGLSQRPSEMTFASIWRFAGAVQQVPAHATAFGDRSMPFMLSLDAIWSRPEDDGANIAWVRTLWTRMQRHSTGRLYLNFPGHGEGESLVRDAFGAETYARLQQIKGLYDPENLFRMNQNIVPIS